MHPALPWCTLHDPEALHFASYTLHHPDAPQIATAHPCNTSSQPEATCIILMNPTVHPPSPLTILNHPASHSCNPLCTDAPHHIAMVHPAAPHIALIHPPDAPYIAMLHPASHAVHPGSSCCTLLCCSTPHTPTTPHWINLTPWRLCHPRNTA